VLCQVLGDVADFEKAVRLVIEDVIFDTDVVVSVFETNIRVLGCVMSLLYRYLFGCPSMSDRSCICCLLSVTLYLS